VRTGFIGYPEESGKKVNSYHQRYFILMIGKRFLYILRRCGYPEPESNVEKNNFLIFIL
jgi:hypothetical protein